MALPDYLLKEVGTAKVWKSSAGDYALTCTSVTDGNGRQGVKGDLGQYRARRWVVEFTSSVGVAATAGKEIELYWAPSTSGTAGTDNPGGLSGTDATFNTTPDEYKAQLVLLGALELSNNATTTIQKQYFIFEPLTRYGMPVVVNKSGQTLGSTAGDHTVTLTPDLEGVYDTSAG
jgi:hypothetical protein